jgi:hypothetical protein
MTMDTVPIRVREPVDGECLVIGVPAGGLVAVLLLN